MCYPSPILPHGPPELTTTAKRLSVHIQGHYCIHLISPSSKRTPHNFSHMWITTLNANSHIYICSARDINKTIWNRAGFANYVWVMWARATSDTQTRHIRYDTIYARIWVMLWLVWNPTFELVGVSRLSEGLHLYVNLFGWLCAFGFRLF